MKNALIFVSITINHFKDSNILYGKKIDINLKHYSFWWYIRAYQNYLQYTWENKIKTSIISQVIYHTILFTNSSLKNYDLIPQNSEHYIFIE